MAANKNTEKYSGLEKGLLIGLGMLGALVVLGIPLMFFLKNWILDQTSSFSLASSTQKNILSSTFAPESATNTQVFTVTPTLKILTPTKTLRPTSTLAPTKFNPEADIIDLNAYLASKNWAMAVKTLDVLIAHFPDNGDFYFERARSYHEMYHGVRIETEGLEYIQNALSDIDQAIVLGKMNWPQFELRYRIYLDLSYIQEYRVDQQYLEKISLDNLIAANALGYTDELRYRYVADMYFDLGMCDEGFRDIQKLIDEQPEDQPSAGLNTIYAHGLVTCKKDYQGALDHIDRAIRIYTSTDRKQVRAFILYYLGRKAEALAEMDQLISDDPSFGGYRYYFRALIRYEMGQKDLAEQDLEMGAGNTWYHGGLFLYVQSKMMFDQGDREEGIRLLKEAEATIYTGIQHDPFAERFRQELAALGEEPLSPGITSPYQATPIAVP